MAIDELKLDLPKTSDTAKVKAQKTNTALLATATKLNEVIAAISSPPEVPNLPPVAVITNDISDLTVTVLGTTSVDTDGTIVAWDWQYGDGATATGRAPAPHTYNDAGAYLILLTVTDNDGAKNTASLSVSVKAPTPSNPDTFILGSTKPIGTAVSTKGNVGTGVVRPAPTGTGGTLTGDQSVAAGQILSGKIINGDVSVASNAKLLDCIIKGRVKLTGTNAVVENNDIQGNGTDYDAGGDTGLVLCSVTSGARNQVRFNRIHNRVSTRAVNGLRLYTMDIYRNEIYDVVDGIDFTGAAPNISVKGNHIHSLISYKRDYNRDRTHNDGVQGQGGAVTYEGNNFEMTWSGLSTAPIDPSYVQLAAIMVNHSVALPKPTIKNNWFSGGQVLVNDLDIKDPQPNIQNQEFTVTGNRFDLSTTSGKGNGHVAVTSQAKATMKLVWSGNTRETGATISAPYYGP